MENNQPKILHADLRAILCLSAAFAALKLAIQIVGNIQAQHAGYGIFRDELYYLVCGRHLAFGYVDQPPLVALQARLSETLFGHDTIWSLRLISGLAGAAKVFLTGVLCCAGRSGAAGERRRSQCLGFLLEGSIWVSMDSCQ